MPHIPTPRGLGLFEAMINAFSDAGRASVRQRLAPRRAGGATLRPGAATPLWRQLAAQVRPLLKRRGEKAQLARLLGVHRQTVHEYFGRGRRMPDAERTLLLLEWLRLRRQGKRPGW